MPLLTSIHPKLPPHEEYFALRDTATVDSRRLMRLAGMMTLLVNTEDCLDALQRNANHGRSIG